MEEQYNRYNGNYKYEPYNKTYLNTNDESKVFIYPRYIYTQVYILYISYCIQYIYIYILSISDEFRLYYRVSQFK